MYIFFQTVKKVRGYFVYNKLQLLWFKYTLLKGHLRINSQINTHPTPAFSMLAKEVALFNFQFFVLLF